MVPVPIHAIVILLILLASVPETVAAGALKHIILFRLHVAIQITMAGGGTAVGVMASTTVHLEHMTVVTYGKKE